MKRVLVTGMSGTGKSSVIQALRQRGYKAVDADEPGWSEYRKMPGLDGGPATEEWVWREDRIQDLLSTEDAEVLFLSGCAINQGQFYSQLDEVVLLTAPVEVMLERLTTRTTNSFGKDPEELANILRDREEVEPLLRRRATAEIDTGAPLDEVVARILELAGQSKTD
jgi:dephospho-CoA kinase